MKRQTTSEFRHSYLAEGEELEPDMFPMLETLSPAFFFQFTPVANTPGYPETVFLPAEAGRQAQMNAARVAVASWNWLWEAAQYRREVFADKRYREELPELMDWIETLPEANIYLLIDTPTKYEAYAPLYHLLPKRVLDRHGLPCLRRPLWPVNGTCSRNEENLPTDFVRLLSHTFARHVWPYLNSGSPIGAFRQSDSLVLLSHSLDFWLPYAISVIEGRMRQFPRVQVESDDQRRQLAELRGMNHPGGTVERPRMGGYLWQGENEAAEALDNLVAAADARGQLRTIIDLIRSNRVVDDFSPRWSRAKEDFERKLYRKRSKIRVSFVELDETLAVHSPRSEYTDNLLWQDFFAMLNRKERHVVVCLRNGTTKLKEIAKTLGYANHSPVSKALAAIRMKASKFLDLN